MTAFFGCMLIACAVLWVGEEIVRRLKLLAVLLCLEVDHRRAVLDEIMGREK